MEKKSNNEKKIKQSDGDLSEVFQYTTPKQYGQDVKGIMESLKKCGMNEIQIYGLFKTDFYMNKFCESTQRQILDQMETTLSVQEDQKKRQKVRPTTYFKIPHQVKQNFKMIHLVFNSGIHLQIFSKKCFEQIKRLQYDYQYKIFPRGKFLQVYYNPKKQAKISSMFTNQIISLKNSLKMLYCRDDQIIRKLKYSPYYRKLLQKQNIQVQIRYFKKNTFAVFYSLDIEVKKMKQIIQKKYLYHITLIHLKDRHLKRVQNEIIFQLIEDSLRKQVEDINEVFQSKTKQNKQLLVWIQANFEESCFAVHDHHQIFSIQPVETMLRSLKDLFVFSLETNNSRAMFNSLQNFKQDYPFVRFAFKRRVITFAINIRQILQKEHLFSFLKAISEFITENPTIRIYPRNFNYDKQQIQRIILIAETKHLNIENFQGVTQKDQISQIKLAFKFTQTQSVKGQLIQFLSTCILKRQLQFSYKANKLFQCSYSNIVHKEVSYQESVSTANQLFEEELQIKKSIIIPFKMPEVKQNLEDAFQIGRLSKDTRQQLEAQLLEQTKKQVHLKVYDLMLKRVPEFQQSMLDPIPLVCRKILPKGSFYIQDLQLISIQDLEKDEDCYIIFKILQNSEKTGQKDVQKGKMPKNKQRQMYVPCYMIKII